MRIATSPMSLSASAGAGERSSVFTSTRCAMRTTDAGVLCGPCLRMYSLPGTSGAASSIHTTIAETSCETCGSLPGWTSVSPREQSTSSASVSATESGGRASPRSPSKVTICLTVVVRRDGSTITRSPGFTQPLATVPANPRKSRFGRFTHCTGKRKSIWFRRPPSGTVSRCSSSVGPEYHGVCALRSTTLSPLSADIGIARMLRAGRRVLNSSKARTISLKRSCEKAPLESVMRSSLFTASTISPIPSKLVMNAWRRVCTLIPWRASTSRIARSQVLAPVAMLRVNCSWPGVSAMMNLRAAVVK